MHLLLCDKKTVLHSMDTETIFQKEIFKSTNQLNTYVMDSMYDVFHFKLVSLIQKD